MAAVTQMIPSYLGGVSKQTDKKKLPGQVRECLNAYPDPTFGLRKRPGLKFIKTLHESSDTSSPDFANAKWFFIKRDNEEKYVGCILDKDVEATNPIKIWNADGTACTVTYPDGVNYLDTTRDNYDILTVQDNSVITNKTKVVAKQADPTFTLNAAGTVRLFQVKYSCQYKVSIKIDGTTHDATYTSIAEEATPPAGPGGQLVNTAEKILSELKTAIEALSLPGTMTVTQLEATLELSYVDSSSDPAAFELTTSDNQGNATIRGFTQQVNVVSDLPADSVHNRVVKLVNSKNGTTEDTYWSIFVAENETSGAGYWKETIDPTVSPGMDSSTLPHQLRNTALNTFVFDKAAWVDRKVGDLDTNSDPSFVGYAIQQTFFHNNRLGILSEDNVAMSKSGEFYDFYHASALTQTASDPIDINCSSIRPAVLHAVIPTAQGLILFSKNQQFILFSDGEILTPTSAVIRGVSNYEMDANIDPVDVGTHINFVSKTPSYTRVFGAQTRGSEESPVVNDISKVVSEWIPDTVTNLLTSPQNFLIALYGPLDNTMYMHKTYAVGDRIEMQAWFKWDLPGNIQHTAVDSDSMWTVVETNGKYILASASLTQTPEETIMTTADGQQINPHMDMYTAANNGKINDIVTATNNAATETARTPNTYTPAAHAKGASFQVVVADAGSGVGGAVTVTRLTNGSGYAVNDTITLASADIGGGTDITVTVTAVNEEKKVVYDAAGDFSKCYIPYADLTTLNPVILIAGNATQDFAGVTEFGFTVNPTRATDSDGTYFKVARKDLSTQAANVYVGYQYNYDIELPKTYFKLNPEGSVKDYTASLTIARMKFAVGLSSVIGFKVKSKGYRGELAEFTGDGSTTAFSVPFPLKEENGIVVKLDGAKQASTAYSVTTTDSQATVTFDTAPEKYMVNSLYGGSGYTAANGVATTSANGTGLTVDTTVTNGVITGLTIHGGSNYVEGEIVSVTSATGGAAGGFKVGPPQKIEITTDTWYDVQPVHDSDQYLADDVPLIEESVFTIPLHQRSDNFNLKIFSNSPFPVSLSSMMWEGNYSPRFYRRT